MAENNLKHLSRAELVQIIYALQQREQKLSAQVDELTQQLNDRTIQIMNAGSIAQAAMTLNHVFEDAQAAADQYLDSIRAASTHARGQLDFLQQEAQQTADTTLANARRQADRILQDARSQAQQLPPMPLPESFLEQYQQFYTLLNDE